MICQKSNPLDSSNRPACLCFLSILFLTTISCFSQVGIGTTTPDASTILDVVAGDKGILIPRVSLTNVTTTMLDGTNTAATGLLIYNTNAAVVGGDGVGFYSFNGTIWEKILTSSSTGITDSDFFEEGTTSPPNDINDDIYTQGNVAIGKTTADYALDIQELSTDRAINISMNSSATGIVKGQSITNTSTNASIVVGTSHTLSGNGVNKRGIWTDIVSGTGTHYGIFNNVGGTGSGSRYGSYNSVAGFGNGTHYGSYNRAGGPDDGIRYGSFQEVSSDGDGTHTGSYNYISGDGLGIHYGTQNIVFGGGSGDHYGSYNILTGGNGNKFGVYTTIASISGGTHYGVYSDVLKTGSFAGYFLGNVSIGTSAANNYILPTSRGTTNQVMQTDASGNVSWVDGIAVGTDDQNISGSALSGTNLTIGIENGTSQIINLASLQDGIGTDDQNISGSGLSGTTLTIGIENGASEAIDLSSLQDGVGTDNQNLTGATLTGNTLQIDIEDGTSTSVDLTALNTGGDITGVIAGAGLTGGGTTGDVTLNVIATNGLTANTNDIVLGGALTQATTITQGTNNLAFNLNTTGDFQIQDNGTTHFELRDDGNLYLGGDTYWRSGNSGGTNLARLYYTGVANNSSFELYKDALVQHQFNSAGTSVINELGQDFDFRIEGDTNANLFYTDASTDRIGILTNNPNFDIHVQQSNTTEAGSGGIGLVNGANSWKIYHSGIHFSFSENGVRRAYITAATGAYVATSDRRLKKNISEVESILSKITRLKTYRYLYKDQEVSAKKTIGFMAQDIQKEFPELVETGENGFLGLNYAGFGVIAIKAIQEQQIIIDSQEKIIQKLQKSQDETNALLKQLLVRIEGLEDKN